MMLASFFTGTEDPQLVRDSIAARNTEEDVTR